MVRTGQTRRHEALRAFLVECRDKAGLSQTDLAKRLRRSQSYVSYVETGQKLVGRRRVDGMGRGHVFDAREAIVRLAKFPGK